MLRYFNITAGAFAPKYYAGLFCDFRTAHFLVSIRKTDVSKSELIPQR